MDARPAEFLREVGPGEVEDKLVNEARASTWTFGVEIALVTLTSGARIIVSGGRDGITFGTIDLGLEFPALLVDGPGHSSMVSRIDWHTHPIATGPPDGDREAIRILGQMEPRIFVIGGERDGTRFGPGREKPGGD